jgi:hypothetical protein
VAPCKRLVLILALATAQILYPSSELLWSNHIAGASVLVQVKGPQGFTSDFDKALLTGLCYPIVRPITPGLFQIVKTWTAASNV